MADPVSQLNVLSPESCADCGFCCEGIGSPIVLYASRPSSHGPHPFRPADLPAELIAEIDEHFVGLFRGQEPQERCLWFDPVARQCQHYEFRPQICRDYELGGSECRRLRKKRQSELFHPTFPPTLPSQPATVNVVPAARDLNDRSD